MHFFLLQNTKGDVLKMLFFFLYNVVLDPIDSLSLTHTHTHTHTHNEILFKISSFMFHRGEKNVIQFWKDGWCR